MVPQRVLVINISTTVQDSEVTPVISALNKQIDGDFAPLWNACCVLELHPKGDPIPTDLPQLVIADTTTQAGALGFHDVTNDPVDPQPIGYVFTQTSKMYGEQWSTTASHEILELLGDPNIVLCAGPMSDGRVYAYENCDAVEAISYQIDGVEVSDFVTPDWFSESPARKYSFKDSVTRPLQLAHGGYISVLSNNQWSQITADKNQRTLMKSRPPLLSRRERRRVGKSNWIRSNPRI